MVKSPLKKNCDSVSENIIYESIVVQRRGNIMNYETIKI